MADSTVITHVIGTAALLSMFFIIGNYYDGFYTNLNKEALSAQLGQVADNIASNIIDLVTLSQLTDTDSFLLKTLEPPAFIGQRLYNVSLITMTPTYGDDDLTRILIRIDEFGIYETSDLLWSLDAGIDIYTDQTVNKPANVTISSSILSDAAASRAAQTKKFAKIIVWCDRTAGNLTIGLGIVDLTKGG